MVAPRKTAFAEESAEVEVLFANMEKLKGLTKKIQGSLNRLETSGKTVEDAIGPIYGNTQRLQTTNSNVDKIIDAIDRIRAPVDQRNREERIIRAGYVVFRISSSPDVHHQSSPQKSGLNEYIASLDRTTQALADLKQSNLRSNQQAISELQSLLKLGTRQLEDVSREFLREESRPIEPLHYITKQLPFPALPQDKISRLRLINNYISASIAQLSSGDVRETPTAKVYADIRGEYINVSLRNLAAASVTTARKTSPDALYRQGTSGIGTYAQGLEGAWRAEYDNICPIFARDEWGRVYGSTCRVSLDEFGRTLNALNEHIRANLTTDCFLAYEIVGIVTELSMRLDAATGGELKRPLGDALRPVRDTAKASLSKLLDDTRNRAAMLISLPQDGAAVPVTADALSRLQAMTAYIGPLGSIMTSLGDGGWGGSSRRPGAASANGAHFDVGADGRELFAHYAADTVDALLSALEGKARSILKTRSLQGVFIVNNVVVAERMIRASDLAPLLMSGSAGGSRPPSQQQGVGAGGGAGGIRPVLDAWRKRGVAAYSDAWREPSSQLLDVQYTNRGARPHSGGQGPGGVIDSTAVVKALSSKDKDAIKEKFRNFNTSFDDLVQKHKGYKLEKEVRPLLAREVQQVIEPLYGRFWDRYHEVDKGKGKYVKYDKNQLAATLASLG
ncbi:Cullin repeat-like-containing domain protein [Lineolata rhizophorae]|uniref:Exocyst complex protein EXO70 n=1 Tax=Lineolata rhizophorae TaxID=578093 RepID=A0A6A6NX90_9PEZI|nr:Cullin repeat-like-containing domain protein [Lineolata rhizophorae]